MKKKPPILPPAYDAGAYAASLVARSLPVAWVQALAQAGPMPAILILILLTSSAIAKPRAVEGFRHCLIKVDRKVYLNERCKVVVGEKGATLGVAEIAEGGPSKYFAYVNTLANGSSSWNGPNAESHAHDPLGDLRRQGNCWINKRAKICIGKKMGKQKLAKEDGT